MTRFERYGTVFDMNANHELTAQIAKMFAVLNLCHVSSENVPKQNEQNSVWVQHFFQIINVTNCSSDFEGIANEIEATFDILQGVAQAASRQPISWLAKTWTHGWRKSPDQVLSEQTT